ncbi:ABC transporter permease [Microbacterium sp. NPDC019599]|uniref:ABC transporter permease n=1 Tax=Microbacterium sp. NPDC019599 TaxID=3154690 RepID=UPI0033CE628B
MLKLTAANVLRAIAVFFVVTLTTFVLVYANPMAIARNLMGINATEAAVQAKAEQLGLDQPVLQQYWQWLQALFRGDLGTSYYTGQEVTDTLAIRLPVTLAIMIVVLLLTIVFSVVVGAVAATRGGWVDRMLQFISVAFSAVPSFIVAIVLVFAFAIALPIFPATGYVPIEDGLGAWAASIALPVTAILLGSVASAAAQFRSAVKDVLDRDFVRTLRARGVPERLIIYKHVLRSAGGPGLTVLALLTVGLVGGVVIIEQVFALPGMGALVTTASSGGDIPVVMGCVAVTVILVSIVNLLADLATAALNPKVRAA